MKQACNAISAKARAMMAKQLEASAYEELSKKNELSDIIRYLKQSAGYQYVLKDVREYQVHRGQLEQMLLRAYYQKMMKLYRYRDLKCEQFFSLFIKKSEINLILMKVRSFMTNKEDDIARYPLFYDEVTSYSVMDLVSCHNIDDLIKVLHNRDYEKILSKYRKEINYTLIERDFINYYYKHSLEIIKKEVNSDKAIMEFYAKQLELYNLNVIYRARFFFNYRKEEIMPMLIDQSYYFKREKFDALFTLDKAKFEQILAKSKYHLALDKEDFEICTKRYLYNLAKKEIRYSTSPYVHYVAFEILSRSEVENLILLIESNHYGQSYEDIEAQLIY